MVSTHIIKKSRNYEIYIKAIEVKCPIVILTFTSHVGAITQWINGRH